VARPQEPAQDEGECVVDDQALHLLEDALLVVFVVLRHLASPAMRRRHRWRWRCPGGDHEAPGDSPPTPG